LVYPLLIFPPVPIAADVYRRIVRAKIYIDENFQQPLDLDRLAREACISMRRRTY